MAVTAEKPAPYAPASTIIEIIERFRSRGFPTPINGDVLGRSGIVTESLIPRTLQAIEALDLVDEDGKPTAVFDGLRLAPEAEFEQRMGDWIKAAYADVFAFVDPAKDDDTRIRDAFRSYRPIGQQERMVTLFTGLCHRAKLIAEKAPQPPRQRPTTTTQGQNAGGRIVRTRDLNRRPEKAPKLTVVTNEGSANPIPTPLAGLLATLPAAQDGWTKEKRDGFMAAFGSVLDFCIPVFDFGGTGAEKANGGK
ncbi:MAG: DUF5343 domain-containing protein [Hyphomicrobium sp.]